MTLYTTLAILHYSTYLLEEVGGDPERQPHLEVALQGSKEEHGEDVGVGSGGIVLVSIFRRREYMNRIASSSRMPPEMVYYPYFRKTGKLEKKDYSRIAVATRFQSRWLTPLSTARRTEMMEARYSKPESTSSSFCVYPYTLFSRPRNLKPI